MIKADVLPGVRDITSWKLLKADVKIHSLLKKFKIKTRNSDILDFNHF